MLYRHMIRKHFPGTTPGFHRLQEYARMSSQLQEKEAYFKRMNRLAEEKLLDLGLPIRSGKIFDLDSTLDGMDLHLLREYLVNKSQFQEIHD